jgi:hypothetical protein
LIILSKVGIKAAATNLTKKLGIIMSKLDKAQVLEDFDKAYQAANGKQPEVVAKAGWYSVDGGKNMRLADLAALTEELSSGTAAAAPEKAAKPAKKAAAKPAKKAAVKTVETKDKGMVIVKNNEDGYTAEEFWIVYLAEKEHDCRLPQGIV